jgi:hypothetical protein
MEDFNTNLNLGGLGIGSANPLGVQSQLTPIQQPSQPSAFRRIMGSATGIAGNMFAPGLGSALGNVIGGRSLSSSAGFNSLMSNAQASTAESTAEANQMLQIAQQSNQEQEAVEMKANLQKSKHDTAMSVIQSIGS